MATGYTADIEKGISFEKFVMQCARAFGALVMMRDDPMDAEVPKEFKPQPYYIKRLKEAEEQEEKISKMTIKEATAEAKKEHDKEKIRCEERIKEIGELKAKYKAMLKKVHEWMVPSAEHAELKIFMIQQIQTSIDGDCSETLVSMYKKDMKECLTGDQWKKSRLIDIMKDKAYYTNEYAKELERCNSRTDWVKKLRESLR